MYSRQNCYIVVVNIFSVPPDESEVGHTIFVFGYLCTALYAKVFEILYHVADLQNPDPSLYSVVRKVDIRFCINILFCF